MTFVRWQSGSVGKIRTWTLGLAVLSFSALFSPVSPLCILCQPPSNSLNQLYHWRSFPGRVKFRKQDSFPIPMCSAFECYVCDPMPLTSYDLSSHECGEPEWWKIVLVTFLDKFFWILGCYVEGPSQIQADGLPIWDDFRWRLIRSHLKVRKERNSWDMVSYNGGFNCFQILGVHDPFLDSILHVESY